MRQQTLLTIYYNTIDKKLIKIFNRFANLSRYEIVVKLLLRTNVYQYKQYLY